MINSLILKTKTLFGLRIRVITSTKEMTTIQLWMPIQSLSKTIKTSWWRDWIEPQHSLRWDGIKLVLMNATMSRDLSMLFLKLIGIKTQISTWKCLEEATWEELHLTHGWLSMMMPSKTITELWTSKDSILKLKLKLWRRILPQSNWESNLKKSNFKAIFLSLSTISTKLLRTIQKLWSWIQWTSMPSQTSVSFI